MGAIEKTLQALDERVGGACQVVAICGRNKTLIQRLSNRCVPALGTIAARNCLKSGMPERCHMCQEFCDSTGRLVEA